MLTRARPRSARKAYGRSAEPGAPFEGGEIDCQYIKSSFSPLRRGRHGHAQGWATAPGAEWRRDAAVRLRSSASSVCLVRLRRAEERDAARG